MKFSVEWLGILGNILLVSSYLPQIYKTLKTKSGGDISILMCVIWVLGDACFLTYSIMKAETAFIVLFSLFLIENLMVLYLGILYRKPLKAHENLT